MNLYGDGRRISVDEVKKTTILKDGTRATYFNLKSRVCTHARKLGEEDYIEFLKLIAKGHDTKTAAKMRCAAHSTICRETLKYIAQAQYDEKTE